MRSAFVGGGNMASAMIGGLVARIGGTVYDGSVSMRLEKMRDRLLQSR